MPGLETFSPFRSEQPTTDSSSRAKVDNKGQAHPTQLLADGDGCRATREKFNVNVQTGGVSLSVPIVTSPGRSGFGPCLNLVYNSGSSATNGIFGLGWLLEGVESITRATSKSIPLYNDDADAFLHSQLGELVPVLENDRWDETTRGIYRVRQYQPRAESDPTRIERWVEIAEPSRVHWRTISSENVAVVYGRTAESRISQGTDQLPRPECCLSWLASETYDSYGNHMLYEYKAEDGAGVQPAQDIAEANRSDPVRCRQRYLKAVKYGNTVPNRDLNDWSVLPQPPTDQHWMFQVVLDYGEHDKEAPTPGDRGQWAIRPDPFSVCAGGFELRTYRLCQRILMFHNFEELGPLDCLISSTAFQYEAEEKSLASFLKSCMVSGYSHFDQGAYASQSLPPTEFQYTQFRDPGNLQAEDVDLKLSGLPSRRAQWVDLNGDGAPGVLVDIPDGGWYYHPNESDDTQAHIGGPNLFPSIPNGGNSKDWSFEDLDGDGLLDLVSISPDGALLGFSKHSQTGGWEKFVPFTSCPTVGPFQTRWEVSRIDLTGDGHADLLRMAPGEDGELAWHRSLGSGGYGEEQRTKGAPKFPADETGSMFLCDMNGDGLTDIAWVRNGHVCFWPNLGHVLLDGFNFSPRRIRMADLTGSGGTDIIYLRPQGGAWVYYNRWGNSWSGGYCLSPLPPLDGLCSVDVLDVGGRGTPCLCWADLRGNTTNVASTTVRFVDLMGGHRPGLLRKTTNGIGGESTIDYRSSTRFCRDDKRMGKAWATRLPFSIDCVKSMSFTDHVAQTSYTKSYTYHNGYYDSTERRFCGFQTVEECETEDFAVGVSDTQFKRSPIITKSWFYIGLERLDIGMALPDSFEAINSQKPVSSAKMPCSLTAAERREAYIALTGKPRGKNVVIYQRAQSNRHGVFRRDRSEPRVQQMLTLETDQYSNTTKRLMINYGRLTSPLRLPEDQQKQTETSLVYSETNYTNAIDSLDMEPDYFQIPVVFETVQYRVYPGSCLTEAIIDGRYDFEKLAANDCELLKQDRICNIPSDGYKALITKNRTLYSGTDLNGPLPKGELQQFSVQWQSYQLFATTKLLAVVLEVPSRGELIQGGYVELEPGDWWAPSTRNLFGDDTVNNRLPAARSQFYIPNGEMLDHFSLLKTENVDAMGNRTLFSNDYARLQPTLITDANGNRTQTALDSLGRRAGVAVMGKEGEPVGDSLDKFSADLTEDQRERFFNNPLGTAEELLKDAGQRAIYCLGWFQQEKVCPAFQAELVRDTHYKDGRGQISISITYLSGKGEAIQQVCLSEADKTEKWQFSSGVTSMKGLCVKEFLPFFKSSHKFYPQTHMSNRPATIFLLDPLDRTVGVLNADHTWSKTQFMPWAQVYYDAGDTVLIEDPATDEDIGSYMRGLDKGSYYPTWYYQRMARDTTEEEKKAARKSKCYNNTPKSEYDERGNISALMDALARDVTKTGYDLLGRPLHSVNMDSGDRWLLSDCNGLPLLSWSSGGPRKRTIYDTLRRVEAIKVQISEADEYDAVVVKNEYGESYKPDPEARNLRGQLYRCWDQSGSQTNVCFDFKGNCMQSSIRYAEEYDELLDWSTDDVKLAPSAYTTTSTFDAVGHTLHTTTAGGQGIDNIFDVAGRLKRVTSTTSEDNHTSTSNAHNIEYSEGNEATLIEYGNGSRTLHTYDSLTRRLVGTSITRKDDKTALQNLSYIHDCLGKIVQKTDRAQQTIYFNNQVVKPNQEFNYDALGQLCSATGREQVDVPGHRMIPYGPALGQPNPVPGDGSQLIEYYETYKYDQAGNILETKHQPVDDPTYSPWTRTYAYDTANNRLISTKVGSTIDNYKYEGDAGLNGCITRMAGYSLVWDYNNQLRSFSTQRVKESGIPERTWYIYNSRGKRVRKVTVRDTGTKLKETLYLPCCDISVTYSGDGVSISRKTTSTEVGNLNASGSSMAVVETKADDNSGSVQNLVRYQMSDNLELDDTGKVISYEEYSPYGSSTYQSRAVEAPRKYRFARYQRDNESGLNLCGERYYASWLGRWTSADPLGIVDGLNLYTYVSNNPISFHDPLGTWAISSEATWMHTARDNIHPQAEATAGGQKKQQGKAQPNTGAKQRDKLQTIEKKAPQLSAGEENEEEPVIIDSPFGSRKSNSGKPSGKQQGGKLPKGNNTKLEERIYGQSANYTKEQVFASLEAADKIMNSNGSPVQFNGGKRKYSNAQSSKPVS
ncbi:SpvB-domain-containing protein [Aspergillus alliaceus]|uniref:SpvB-domain-containing protein n=1 Tax=Petromyces alliaceus TaxID=209559 RepID=A0A5N7BR46_PETAA|nr:SpvB-domain-containing protein [Aspergillus alliaceus]